MPDYWDAIQRMTRGLGWCFFTDSDGCLYILAFPRG